MNREFLRRIGKRGKALLLFSVVIFKRRRMPLTLGISEPTRPAVPGRARSSKRLTIPLPFSNLCWVEKRLVELNRKLVGEDRPESEPHFLQPFPPALLKAAIITPQIVAEAAKELVVSSSANIGSWKAPFRKPRVEFTRHHLRGEPAHIEFGELETKIRIHPDYIEDPFRLAAVLCHELSHFIIDHNDIREPDHLESEKITDLFVFRAGLGLIRLQGVLDVTYQDQKQVISKLGYLDLHTMAYAHVRCAAQQGVPLDEIDRCLVGEVKSSVGRAMDFLAPRGDLAEVLLCPNRHVLLIPRDRDGALVHCTKCGWKRQVWLHRRNETASLMTFGVREYELGNIDKALSYFREVQGIDALNSAAYCWASRSLCKLGRREEAIRELRKLLLKRPEDQDAQIEMKKLLGRY